MQQSAAEVRDQAADKAAELKDKAAGKAGEVRQLWTHACNVSCTLEYTVLPFGRDGLARPCHDSPWRCTVSSTVLLGCG